MDALPAQQAKKLNTLVANDSGELDANGATPAFLAGLQNPMDASALVNRLSELQGGQAARDAPAASSEGAAAAASGPSNSARGASASLVAATAATLLLAAALL
jgi:hypothetical protein